MSLTISSTLTVRFSPYYSNYNLIGSSAITAKYQSTLAENKRNEEKPKSFSPKQSPNAI